MTTVLPASESDSALAVAAAFAVVAVVAVDGTATVAVVRTPALDAEFGPAVGARSTLVTAP
jgi:hypothetical protein